MAPKRCKCPRVPQVFAVEVLSLTAAMKREKLVVSVFANWLPCLDLSQNEGKPGVRPDSRLVSGR